MGSSVDSLSSVRMAKGLVVAMVVGEGGCVEMLKCGEGVASKETMWGSNFLDVVKVLSSHGT